MHGWGGRAGEGDASSASHRSREEARCRAELVAIVQRTQWLMSALAAVRALGLPNACIGAGAVRTAVWDALHARPSAAGGARVPQLSDVDVAYFDGSDTSRERDQAYAARLEGLAPEFAWDVTNQAGVHHWFEQVFGHAVAPLQSLEEAVASWPETATCVGVTLSEAGEIGVVAPLGLRDLFAMVVRRNPARVSVPVYRERVRSKGFRERWPRVRVFLE